MSDETVVILRTFFLEALYLSGTVIFLSLSTCPASAEVRLFRVEVPLRLFAGSEEDRPMSP